MEQNTLLLENKIEIDATSSLNFVLQQNAIHVLREIRLYAKETVEQSSLKISANPAFLVPFHLALSTIDANHPLMIDKPKLNFDVQFLQQLNENIQAQIQIHWLSAKGEILQQYCHDVELLTVDTWGGEQQPLELLASFVQPNVAALKPLLVKSSEWLQSSRQASLNAYQDRDKDSVIQQLQALWYVLQQQNLQYVVNPASFVRKGQRIRLAKQVLEEKLACCLDSTVLFCALAEHIGLDTLVVLEKEHAYVGVWLQQTPNVDLLIDDVQMLRKRLDLGEVIFIESTGLMQHMNFAQAKNLGAAHIQQQEQQQKFYVAVDIRQARLRGIRPLSLYDQTALNTLQQAEENLIWQHSTTVNYDTEDLQDTAPNVSRVDRWLRRLLDLSLRNKLLNFKDNRLSIPLQCSELTLAKLEDALSNQQKFLFKSTDTIALQGVQRENEQQHITQYIDDNLVKNMLFSPLDSATLDKRLVEVFRASRTALEEGGANTLFLAIGFLEWKESERAKRSFKAPLLLIPVQISRETAKTGYKLCIYDDEARFNSTLLQLLRQDFELEIPGLHPLPTDDSGVDVAKVLYLVRKAIVNIAGWEVSADAAIGQFSFSKYLMWLDLSSRMEALKAQPVVQHLIETPREAFLKQEEFPRPQELDQHYQPQQLFTPLSADSSQLSAVMSAALGRTFVLSGPPGTGKSQTITNMVAQCLADGKSVLFVSEKMAALDVVYRRLSQIGLNELCLQLHSSKAQKMEVLDQLRERAQKNNQAFAQPLVADSTQWQQLSDRLVASRDELNQHVTLLHQQHPIGWSLYAALSDALCYRELPVVKFHDIQIETLTAHERESQQEILTQAISIKQLLSSEQIKALSGFAEDIDHQIWSLAWQEQYVQLQQHIAETIAKIEQQLQPWQQHCGLQSESTLKAWQQELYQYDMIRTNAERMDLSLLNVIQATDPSVLQQAADCVTHLKDLRLSLIGTYQAEIYQADLNALDLKWREAEAKIWPFSWFAKFQLRNFIKTYQHNAPRPTALAVAQDLPILLKIQQLQQNFQQYSVQLAPQLGQYWQTEETQWDKLQLNSKIWQQLQQQFQGSMTAAQWLTILPFAQVQSLTELKQHLEQLQQQFNQLLVDHALVQDVADYALIPSHYVLARQQQLQEHRLIWRHWLTWQYLGQQLEIKGLYPLSQLIVQDDFTPDVAQRLLTTNLQRQWIVYQFSQYPELNRFNSQQQQQKIDNFSQQDYAHQRAASEEIIQRWNKIFDTQDDFKPQWTLLNKELGKKRRHIPVRELMRQIPDVLKGLKPCLLMSPLSVAQYLDTTATFDVVIFDEASQIPVWDAIGALARGAQSIVVGDNKQMPPTSFFGKGESDEELDLEATEDLESILDECLAAQLPELALNWHYRSRYESLIQFSNQKYYKGELLTFPAPVAKDNAVVLHTVDGVYDKGDTRTNLTEAKAIVEFILQHLTQQLTQEKPLTLGVVTFNMTQQKLIEDLLDNELASKPDLEALSKAGIEPLFVKNLENVQGDERDIIIFSITYAKDQRGQLSMNFGALNRQGGQRRLNVAITRARQGLHVFSALHPEEINLTRTNSEGVRDLKDFLSFARSGQLNVQLQQITKFTNKQEFMRYIQQQLQQQGWHVDIGIGRGESKVDLAIKANNTDTAYILGILVDGEIYATAATARDRDQLRKSVLTGLGWKILSIWIIDWYLEPEQNLQQLLKKVNQLQSESV